MQNIADRPREDVVKKKNLMNFNPRKCNEDTGDCEEIEMQPIY